MENTVVAAPTVGEKRVRVSFNPSNTGLVDQIKQQTASLIDTLQAMRNDEVVKPDNDTPQSLQDNASEKFRLIALAQTAYEEAAMWAVKAATS